MGFEWYVLRSENFYRLWLYCFGFRDDPFQNPVLEGGFNLVVLDRFIGFTFSYF